MKVLQVNYSDIEGGAARAAYRIHRALRQYGIDSRMNVIKASSGDWTVKKPEHFWTKTLCGVRNALSLSINDKIFHTESRNLHSTAFFPSRWPQRLNHSDADIIHLHWLNSEMISIADIGRIQKPIVWTLHDMWGFCGAEHFTEDFRWRDGYSRDNRPAYESGFDLNLWTWQRKLKHWHQPMHIVTPSRWLAESAGHSILMRGWPITLIPNAINTEVWRPVDKILVRKLLHLPVDHPLLLIGAMGGTYCPRKGFNYLKAALDQLRDKIAGLELIIVGQLEPKEPMDLGFPVHYIGNLHDDVSLRMYYSAADAVVVPSRQDNLPNSGVEAQACGTPVVAFNTCGLPDIVEHKITGYLARPFDTEDLAQGIRWVLDGDERRAMLCDQSRQTAVRRFSYPVVAKQYQQLYEEVASCKG
jgi:glycosyltransferase involved in cell wall biosynthesis